jgi:hypothetical protein
VGGADQPRFLCEKEIAHCTKRIVLLVTAGVVMATLLAVDAGLAAAQGPRRRPRGTIFVPIPVPHCELIVASMTAAPQATPPVYPRPPRSSPRERSQAVQPHHRSALPPRATTSTQALQSTKLLRPATPLTSREQSKAAQRPET